jgi:hypothetical protein
MAICALPRPIRTLACVLRAIPRLTLRAATGCRHRHSVRALSVSVSGAGTSWDILGSARQCVQCDAASGVAIRSEGRNDVGARQRPNTDANQRGRASVSSSAGNGGSPKRLATAGAIEALLYSDGRPRYQAVEHRAGLCRAERRDHRRSVRMIAYGQRRAAAECGTSIAEPIGRAPGGRRCRFRS